MDKKFKTLSERLRRDVETDVKTLLTSSREYMRYDSNKVAYDVNHGDYAEAFGIMKCLSILGYRTINSAVNTPQDYSNLRWWLSKLEKEVLCETGYVGS